jgi:leucyl/phenylalanyl-tRNA--protein transferase
MPEEPPPSRWSFPEPGRFDPANDLVAIGADLEPGTLLSAYRQGLFPMPSGRRGGPPAWFCPVRRGVLPLAALHISRTLRRTRRTFEIRVDTAFSEVVDGCADPSRSGGWIDGSIASAYLRLHRLGWAHSVEAWRGGELAGGVYGLAIGGLFAGESMFHKETDASKAALAGLVDLLSDRHADARLLDVQWRTPHLATLGVIEIPRVEYLARLPGLLVVPEPSWPPG